MLIVQLEVDKRIKKGEKIPKNIMVTDINQLLSRLDKKAEEQGLPSSLVLRILKEGTILFTDQYELGKGEVRNILLLVRSTLDTTFEQVDEKTKKQLLDLLQESLTNQVPTTSSPLPKQQEIKKISKKEVPRKASTLKKKKNLIQKKKSSSIRLKTFIISAVLLVFVSVSCFIGYAKLTAPQRVEERISLERYLADKHYDQAVEEYHTEKDMQQIMRELAMNQKIEDINLFQKKYPTRIGEFYQKFYSSDWTFIINNPPQKIESSEQIMLAHAYIQLGQLEEATVLNQVLKSDRIKQEIQDEKLQKAVVYLRKGQLSEAESLQKELQSSTLADLIEEAKTYLNLIQLYKDRKDTESQQRWEKVLSNIGKEE